VRDWSVTAWGESGTVQVFKDGEETAHMPSYLDDKSDVPDPIPEPEPNPTPPTPTPPENCVDTDNGAQDSYGDPCSAYVGNEHWCGGYDDEDFKSNEMCCACGGGASGDGDGDDGDDGDDEDEYGDDDEDEYGDDDEDEYGDDDEDEYGDDGDDGDNADGDQVCVDIDNGIKDDYNDGCAEYAQNTHWCGNYDTATFKSMEMCCSCVATGGETGGEMVAKEGQEKFVEFSGGDGKMGISEFEAFYNEYFAVSNSLAQIMQSSSSAQEMFNMYDTDGDGILWPNNFGELWDNLDNGDEGEDEYGDDGEDEYGDDDEDEYGDDGEDEYGDDGEDEYGDDGEDEYGDDGEDEYGDDGEDEYGDDGEDEYGDDYGEDEYGDDGEDEYGDDDGTVEAWEQEFNDWKGDDDVMSFEEFQAWYATKCADCPLAM